MEDKMKQHMWMWYHFEINDTVLFKNWHITTVEGLIIACIIVIFLSILMEFTKWVRWRVDLLCIDNSGKQNSHSFLKRIFNKMNILKSLLLTFQMIISYTLMLVFMTYSVWICLAVTLGMGLGYFLFGNRTFNTPEKIKIMPIRNEVIGNCCN
uniref:Copper transport protein n=1 Tax=Parastrongyloides trichosuri TaxID=131310 RepID=A0A0N4ZYB3_PARTI